MKLKAILLGFLFTLLVLPHTLSAAITSPTITAQWVKGNPTAVNDGVDAVTLRLYLSGDVAPSSDTVILSGFNLLIELDEDFVNEDLIGPENEFFANINVANPSDANVGVDSSNDPVQLLNDFRQIIGAYPCAIELSDQNITNAMRWDQGVSVALPIPGAPTGKTWIGIVGIYQTSIDLSGVGCGSNEDNFYNLVTDVASPAGNQDRAIIADITFVLDGDEVGVGSLEDFFSSVVITNNPGASTSFHFTDLGDPSGGLGFVELGPLGSESYEFDSTLLDPYASVSDWLQMND